MGSNSSEFSFYLIWSVCRWNYKYLASMEKSVRWNNVHKWSSGSIISKPYSSSMELVSARIESGSSIMGNSISRNILTRHDRNRSIYRYNKLSCNVHERSKCIDIHSWDGMGRGKQSTLVLRKWTPTHHGMNTRIVSMSYSGDGMGRMRLHNVDMIRRWKIQRAIQFQAIRFRILERSFSSGSIWGNSRILVDGFKFLIRTYLIYRIRWI